MGDRWTVHPSEALGHRRGLESWGAESGLAGGRGAQTQAFRRGGVQLASRVLILR